MMTPEQIVQVDQVIDLLRPDLAAVVWIMRDGSVETRGVRVSRAVLSRRLRLIADALDRHHCADEERDMLAEVGRRPAPTGFPSIDAHTRMLALADSLAAAGHPGQADLVRAIADEALRGATR